MDLVSLRLIYGVSWDLLHAITSGFMPTAYACWSRPSLLWHPTLLSRTFMAAVWDVWGAETDAGSRAVKDELVTPRARGVVLDIGAGHGSLAHYLDPKRVTAYVALEPNRLMHPRLRENVAKYGYTEAKGNCLILPFGLEEVEAIQDRLVSSGVCKSGRVDTAVAILSICSVPHPDVTVRRFVQELLAPKRGTFIFYEHVQNPQPRIQALQRRVGYVWSVLLDHCVLGQDSETLIRAADDWEEISTHGKPGEDLNSLFWHRAGYCVRR